MSQKLEVRSQKSEVRSKEQEKNLASCLLPLASRIAFVFPGQGSQCIGMAKDFYDRYVDAKTVFEEASNTLGFDMARLCFEGPATELNLTQNTQPALLTASVAILNVLNKETSIKPIFLAGHSLGEYTALVASRALDFKDAVRVVAMRGKFMQEAVPQGMGILRKIIGLTGDMVKDICREASRSGILPDNDNIVVPANFNSPERSEEHTSELQSQFHLVCR